MKHTIIKRIAALLLFAIGLAGCSKEETLPDSPDATRSPISISVTDGGYTSSEKSHTRASENGYITEFTAGDKIGFYVVVNNTIVSNNTPLTYNGSIWTGEAYYGGIGARYFAYYPYQSTLAGELVPTATTATVFFANAVSAWTPTTDQSTHALYTASDLMIGSGILGGKQTGGTVSLSFTMTHAITLVVIETPTAKHTLTTDNNYTWTTEAPDTKFYGFTPYNTSVGVYRHLVKPAQSGADDLMGSYTGANGNTKEYTLTQNNLIAAQYALYKVDGGSTTVIEKSHTLQVGDFFMKDGSLVGKDATLTVAQQAACIGIVYSTDISRIGTAATNALSGKGTIPHGLVMALTNASEGCRWGESRKDENSGGNIGEPFKENTDQLKKQYANVDGYGETQWMVNKIATDGYYYAETYKAFDVASKYGTGTTAKYKAPANTSGWFIPSMGQWWDIISNLGGIDLTGYQNNTTNYIYITGGVAQTAGDNMNRCLNKIDGVPAFGLSTFYWTSSEYDGTDACFVNFRNDGSLGLIVNGKHYRDTRVRCISAF